MQLNLYKLHQKEDKTPRKWICAIGKNLNNRIDIVINEIIKNKGKTNVYVDIKRRYISKIYSLAILKAGSQKNLSKILKVTRQDLYQWAKCKRKIPIISFKKLIRYTNFDINKISFKTKKYVFGWNKQKIAKILANKLGVSINFTERIIYGKRHEIAIIFILELLNLWKELLTKSNKELESKKREIQETFEFLKQNQIRCKKIKAVHNLNIVLSKIIGSILADGSISLNNNSISLVEEGKISVEIFSKWIENIFGITSNIRKVKTNNAWIVKIDNKPIQRYLTNIFNLDKGKKKSGYDFPQIIKDSNFEMKRACTMGIMIFDGVVRINKELGLNIGTKQLRDSVFNVLIKDGISVTKLKNPDKTGMWRLYSSGLKNKKQYKIWLNYFIEGSDKWYRIYEWINGFQGRVSNSKNASIVLKRSFYKKSASKITLAGIFDLFVIYNDLTIHKLLTLFKGKKVYLNESTLWTYTKILREMNLIYKKRLNDNTNIYIYNKDPSSWQLPYRPFLSQYYL